MQSIFPLPLVRVNGYASGRAHFSRAIAVREYLTNRSPLCNVCGTNTTGSLSLSPNSKIPSPPPHVFGRALRTDTLLFSVAVVAFKLSDTFWCWSGIPIDLWQLLLRTRNSIWLRRSACTLPSTTGKVQRWRRRTRTTRFECSFLHSTSGKSGAVIGVLNAMRVQKAIMPGIIGALHSIANMQTLLHREFIREIPFAEKTRDFGLRAYVICYL